MNDVLTVEEAAALLKYTPLTVRKLAGSGEIPGHKFGSEWRFSRRKLEAMLNGSDALPDREPQVA